MVTVINYSHPLTDSQLAELAELEGDIVDVVEIECHVNFHSPLSLLDQVGLLADEALGAIQGLSSLDYIVVLPGLGSAAAAMMAVWQRQFGVFPRYLVLRRVDGSLPPRFEVSEVVEL